MRSRPGVEQAGAYDDAPRHRNDEIRDLVPGDIQPPAARDAVDHDARQDKARKVGKRVPVNVEGPNRNRDGIEAVVKLVEHVTPRNDI